MRQKQSLLGPGGLGVGVGDREGVAVREATPTVSFCHLSLLYRIDSTVATTIRDHRVCAFLGCLFPRGRVLFAAGFQPGHPPAPEGRDGSTSVTAGARSAHSSGHTSLQRCL